MLLKTASDLSSPTGFETKADDFDSPAGRSYFLPECSAHESMAVHDNFSDSQGSRPGGMTERLRMDLNSLAEEEESPKGQRKMMETWIILELCNRGSLQVKSYHRCSTPSEFFSRSV